MGTLTDQVAVVTGAGSGIGRVIASTYAVAGAQVALVGRRLGNLKETAQALPGQEGKDFLLLSADVSNEVEVERVRDAVLGKWGRCDILVNNTGVLRAQGKTLEETTLAEWEETFRGPASGRPRWSGIPCPGLPLVTLHRPK